MEAVYAFCRAVDDVADRRELTGRPVEELYRWRRELRACEGGFPAHPVTVALEPVIRRYEIPVEHFETLIDGVEMDLDPRRYATFEELRVYCEHVASVVGRISVRVFGCRHPAAEKYAHSLGIALQLTNIIRDLRSDLERGRVYLPQDELKRFGYSETDLAAGIRTGAFLRLMEFQWERARAYFKEAEEALKESREFRQLLPAEIMGKVYARLLEKIRDLRFDVFSQRPSVSVKEQLWIAAQLWAGQLI